VLKNFLPVDIALRGSLAVIRLLHQLLKQLATHAQTGFQWLLKQNYSSKIKTYFVIFNNNKMTL